MHLHTLLTCITFIVNTGIAIVVFIIVSVTQINNLFVRINSFVLFYSNVNSNNLGQGLQKWWDNYVDYSIYIRFTGNIFKRNNVKSHANFTSYSLWCCNQTKVPDVYLNIL